MQTRAVVRQKWIWTLIGLRKYLTVVESSDEPAFDSASRQVPSMIQLLVLVAYFLGAAFRSKSELTIENLAFRQQLAVLKAKRPRP